MQNPQTPEPEQPETTSLSYKFQRLREKLRQAVASGELTGKLPGERTLAKRFHVNAKTLSKALTDLAAEGLLDRSIGRGTYVKGSAPVVTAGKRWLVLCDADQQLDEVIGEIRRLHSELEVVNELATVRPSFINQFSAVIDLAAKSRDSLIRDLVVRNIPVVVVGEKPYTFSTHAVQCDFAMGVSLAGRDLLLAGHRRLAAVEPRHSAVVASHLRTAAARYAPQAIVDACFPEDIQAMLDSGVTAFVCGSSPIAVTVKQHLDRLAIAIPGQVSLMAVGTALCQAPCNGYFVPPAEMAASIARLLSDSQSSRPTTIWLAGQHADCQSISPILSAPHDHTMHYRELVG